VNFSVKSFVLTKGFR